MRIATFCILFAVGLVAAFADWFPPLPLVSYRPAQTSSSSTLNTSLIAYWKLDEASGTRVDSETTGTAQNLTDNNTVNQTNGIIGNAAWFIDTNSEMLSVADSADLSSNSNSFSIATWVRFTSLGANRDVATKWGSAGNREFILRYNGGGSLDWLVATNGTTQITVSTNGISVNVWYFIACGLDVGSGTVFVSLNGGPKIEAPTLDKARDTTAIFSIGGRDPGSSPNYMAGFVDELGFWKKALSATEISELYNAGAGKTCCPF